MKHKILSSAVALLAVGCVLVPGVARAESPQDDSGYLFNLSGIGSNFGQKASAAGVNFIASSSIENETIVAGGTKNGNLSGGNYTQGLSFFGADVNLEPSLGVDGHIIAMVDSQFGVTNNGQLVRSDSQFTPWTFGDYYADLKELAYQQYLFNHRASILVGRVDPHFGLGGGFDSVAWDCEFGSEACGSAGESSRDGQKAGYSGASWGGAAFVYLTPKITAQAGIYQFEPILTTTTNNQGFSGSDFGLNQTSGAYLPMQVSYKSTFENSYLPSNYSLGGYIDTATFTNSFLNSKKQLFAEFGGSPQQVHRDSGIWLLAQQMVYRPNPDGEDGLTLFATANIATSPFQIFQNQFTVGEIYQGIIPQRPLDTFNMMFTDAQLNHDVADGTNFLLAKQHIPFHFSPNEYVFEVNYGVALAPGLTFRPYFQYIKNPDQLSTNNVFNEPSVTTVGVLLEINYASLLGLNG
jgi:porin